MKVPRSLFLLQLANASGAATIALMIMGAPPVIVYVCAACTCIGFAIPAGSFFVRFVRDMQQL